MEVVDIMRDAVGVALRIALPILLLTMFIGVLVAIFQAVTQIHEQSLAFILKMAAVLTVLFFAGGWMLELIQDFTRYLYSLM